ncbi:MAG: type II toxin-antitoxin system RelE/ParE family toxin [Nitrospirae bacterium]|nr:type II toxin-antitoxin system RelE/ParE family toxin [Nitrospirota bacterium]
MPYEVRYHPEVRAVDIPLLNAALKKRIRKAIEERLMTAPQQYGEPLRKTLKGYWKMRVGDYRVVFKVVECEVWVLGIINRKDVYDRILKRV